VLKQIILLSGGLDSVVNFRCAVEEGQIEVALTFDYGQIAFSDEAAAAASCSERYSVRHEVIELDWYGSLVNRPIVGGGKIQPFPRGLTADKASLLEEAWMPNRNCVFLSIGAAFAEALGAEAVVIGLNRDEAEVFPDNSAGFLNNMNRVLSASTLSEVRATSYTADLSKQEIVKLGLEVDAPLDLIYSCYKKSLDGRMCGLCQSCVRLKAALRDNDVMDRFQARFVK
jgi:7-cyano-7-deazaguanine synthase